MSLDERVRGLAALVAPPPEGDAEVVRARGARRRRARRIGVSAGSVAVLVAGVAIGIGINGGGPTVPMIADGPDTDVEQAPDAGEVAAHWPVELRYTRNGDTRHLLRFRGASWADWSVEVREPDGSWRLVDREHPGEDFETEGGAFRDEGVTDDEPGFTRAPGPELIAVWRETTGLGERVVVDIEDIPGAGDLVARLGLGPDDVEAYVSPNVLDCDRPLRECIPDGETAARGIAHLPTGFPLYAEEGVAGERTMVWLEAEAIRWADREIAPVPIGETVAPEDAPPGRNIGESCPEDLDTSWTCLDPDQRPPAPEPTLEPLDGEPSPIAALRGQNVVVSVWGSWCGPCARQQSELDRLHATRDDFAIVGIATLDTEQRVAEFVDTHDIDYPMLLDPRGDHAQLLAEALQAVRPDTTRHGVPPATYLVDRDGRIAAWHFGEYDRNELVAAIDGLLH